MFNYNNIQVETNEKGEKVVTMGKEIYTEIIVKVMEAADYEKEQGLNATAEFTRDLWKALCEKEGER